MEPERIDLTPLALPEAHRERIVARVLARARVGIVPPRTPLVELAAWARPALAAAATVAAVALASLTWFERDGVARGEVRMADYEPTPESLGGWLLAGGDPIEALEAAPAAAERTLP